jgi:sodium/potassium/calcium exchanger 6
MQPNPTDVGQFPASRSTWSGLMETGTGGGVYSLVEDHMDNLCVGNSASSTLVGPDGIPASSIGIPSSNWRGAWHDGKQEVKESLTKLWDDIAYDGDLKMHDRVLMLCELPFTVLRKASIPIPCEGYYNRGVIALSIAISPLWFAWYMLGHEINILSPETIGFFMIYWGIAISVGVLVLRFAPGGDGVMSIIIETPIAFYGFIMAATWIDYIADHLVSLLDFIGIILHIPGAVMGLTVLAWGNSMGDLSANMTMA